MTFGTSVVTCFSKYVNFQGRASRSEFWWFALFNALVEICTFFLDKAKGEDTLTISTIVGLILILPWFSAQARRLHDIDKSAWWLLLNIIVLGQIIILIMCIFPGSQGANMFGEDPLLVHENSNTRLENN